MTCVEIHRCTLECWALKDLWILVPGNSAYYSLRSLNFKKGPGERQEKTIILWCIYCVLSVFYMLVHQSPNITMDQAPYWAGREERTDLVSAQFAPIDSDRLNNHIIVYVQITAKRLKCTVGTQLEGLK